MAELPIKTLLARQGIYNINSEVHAYELLYRNDESQTAQINNLNGHEGDRATSSVITQLFANLDINSILGNKPAFINFTHNQLIQKIPYMLPKSRIVIEVLETVTANKKLISSLKDLKDQGYTIALDDYIYKTKNADLIKYADIIKIDVLNQSKQDIEKQLIPLKHFTGILLAEKIESREQFSWCKELGFEYFQGFFLNKPDNIKGKAITENKMNMLQLLGKLNDDNVSMADAEDMILQIPKLSYRVLQLANSASAYKNRSTDSLQDAIKQLGLLQIRNWLNLMLLVSMDNVATDLLSQTLIRAKMCESVAQAIHYPNPAQAYTVGMLSTMEGILNEKMPALLAKIKLCDSLNEALLTHGGKLGEILKFIINHEQAHFNQLDTLEINADEITKAYLNSIEYSNTVMKTIR